MPADLSKYPHWQRLVETNPAYRKAWLEGRFPPGLLGAEKTRQAKQIDRPLPTREMLPSRSIVRPSGGVGTELKKLLARFKITAKVGCKCNARAFEMDQRGIEWCESSREKIIDWLEEEARNRHLPFIRMAAGIMLRMAIRNAKKAARAVG